ncbi:MAG: hypothetical protein A2V69_00545 [Candidatus Portnoybacteria bacterium RBG_13_40_8]|uniref:SCP domain-containing protein n=1 Tax=Candidatus Portnoybacteria bacterium RBG_13_40_8 TaxID=1801990 RepID=A0A1G2F2S2_9BACT|nr:MAG: hypothetical protein A2V69_00545 [Candidatus Portnoybacteria bacterium RBG_13_40_8]OGZ34435.1 MAG: hypothetical protein A2V60_01700 [Candidatus Portnoybacteria bacterium RIFCSPHIGHO2_01_FULL_39_19]
MKKIKLILLIFLVLIIFGGGFFFFWTQIVSLYTKLYLELPKLEKGVGDFLMQEIEKKISIPPPLKSDKEAPESFLIADEVVKYTNAERTKSGLQPLVVNVKLGASAKLKVEDMFNNQYFGHDSPLGITIGDLVASVGYEFISIGENLALGNFEDDIDLVEAWMESPGHRENILNPKYKEIGVAVAKGTFEGKTTWMAVQHFGLPLSICPEPNEAIKTEIETNKVQLKDTEDELGNLLNELEDMRKRDPEYNQKIQEYNNLVSEYNETVGQIKSLIDKYNNQVKSYNICLEANQ